MPEKTANTVNYSVQSAAVVAGVLTFEQWIALAGLVLMLLTFVLNSWLQVRRDKRESELNDLKKDMLKRRKDDLIGEYQSK